MTDPLDPRRGRPVPRGPLDPGLGDRFRRGPGPLRPGFRPIPWTPFGPGDTGAPYPGPIGDRAAAIKAGLEKAQLELTGLRHGPGPDRTPPVVRGVSRAEGLWPWLLVRSQAGDTGARPLEASTIMAIGYGEHNSPDIILTLAGPATEPVVIGRDGTPGLIARNVAEIFPTLVYDVWVHVWNLGRSPATGVRVRAHLGPTNRFLGGRQLDLDDRTGASPHRVIKAGTFTAGQPGDSALGMLTVVAECLSDVATGDRSPGMDRHCAHRLIYTSGI